MLFLGNPDQLSLMLGGAAVQLGKMVGGEGGLE